MRVLIIILLSLLVNHISYGQKTLIIDTLIGYPDAYEQQWPVVQTCFNNVEDYLFEDSILITEFRTRYPQLIATNITSKDVCVLLDDKGGVLQLKNLKHLPADTIRIKKWRIHVNGIDDTTEGKKAYVPMINDSSLRDSVPWRYFVQYKKNKGLTKLNEASIEINDRVYFFLVTTRQEGVHSLFHGYHPRRKYRKYMRLPESSRKKVHYYRMEGQSITRIHLFNGVIDFALIK